MAGFVKLILTIISLLTLYAYVLEAECVDKILLSYPNIC